MRLNKRTLGDVLNRTSGELQGLSATRAALVAGAIAFQSAAVSESFSAVFATPLWIVPAVSISALFALLGFVLAQARAGDTPRAFIIRRVRRSVPATAGAVLLTMFIIGPLTTILPVQRYLLDAQTALYLLNIIGVPQFTLPGVFTFNDLSEMVNTTVWMVPVFVVLVLLIAFLSPATRFRTWVVIAIAPLLVAVAIVVTGTNPASYAASALGGACCGALGALAYARRDVIPIDWRLAAAAAAVIGGVAVIGDRFWADAPLFQVLIALPLTYAALWAGSARIRSDLFFLQWHRWMLPALLIAFPVQQMVVALGPRGQNAVVNLVLSLPAILLFACVAGYVVSRRVIAGELRQHAWEAPLRGQQQRRMPLGQRLRQIALHVLLGAVLLTVSFALLALAYLAMQRENGGL